MTKEDNGVMLACLLTGIMRRSLPRAPAFSFDAPAAQAKHWLAHHRLGRPGPQVSKRRSRPDRGAQKIDTGCGERSTRAPTDPAIGQYAEHESEDYASDMNEARGADTNAYEIGSAASGNSAPWA